MDLNRKTSVDTEELLTKFIWKQQHYFYDKKRTEGAAFSSFYGADVGKLKFTNNDGNGKRSLLTYNFEEGKDDEYGTFHLEIALASPENMQNMMAYADYWESLSDKYETEFTASIKKTYVTDDDIDDFFGKSGKVD